MSRLVNVGDVFNRLTVVSHSHTDSHPRKFWLCKCTCGGEIVTHSGSLRSGNTKSCGCLAKEVKAAKRKPNNHGEIYAVIAGYKRHALRRNKSFGLEYDDVVSLVSGNCFYCGQSPGNTKKTKNTISALVYNGIDRVDNSLGYEIGNVVTCCKVCNRAKGDLSVKDFLLWVKSISAWAEQWGGLVI